MVAEASLQEEAAVRVARGAAWLDENHPGWEERICLPRLDMASSRCCVLGQSFGSFWYVVDSFENEPAQGFLLNWRKAAALGFVYEPESTCRSDEFRELEAAWKNLIAQRRKRAHV